MRARAAFVAAAVLACGPAATGAYARKAPCRLVTDAAGDVDNRAGGVPVFPADNGLDLVGADVATDTTHASAVIRLATAPGSHAAYAKRYLVELRATGLKNALFLSAAVTAGGTTYGFGHVERSATGTTYHLARTAAAGKVDGKTIWLGVKLSDVAAVPELGTLRKGATVHVTLGSGRRVPPTTEVHGHVFAADEAFGRVPYFAGTRSCIPVFRG